MTAYLEHLRAALVAPDFDLPLDLKGTRTDEEIRALMQKLVARFGALLEAWPAIVAAARERNTCAETGWWNCRRNALWFR